MAPKALLGNKVRRLRREAGVTQVRLAGQLGISPSYLNLIEHNQRSLTLPLMLKLGEIFDLDLKSFAEDEDARLAADLGEVFGDPLFRDHDLSSLEMRELAAVSPAACRAIGALYRAYRAAHDDVEALSERLADDSFFVNASHEMRTLLTSIQSFSEILQDHGDLAEDERRRFLGIIADESRRLAPLIDQVLDQATGGGEAPRRPRPPVEDVSDVIQRHLNHFPELEAAADAVAGEAGIQSGDGYRDLAAYLGRRHGVDVVLDESAQASGTLRRYDVAARTLVLSERLAPSGRCFHLAAQIALLEGAEAIDGIIASADVQADSENVLRRALANYFAAALLMPYEPFLQTAKDLRYDIRRLGQRFGTSFEQVCHRLTSLQRPGAKGIPLHFLRIDTAGNVSKGFSASGIRIARFGGLCGRWAAHAAFLRPAEIHCQVSRMADGTAYFDVARTVRKLGRGPHDPAPVYAIGLGCELGYARDLVYADGYPLEGDDGTVAVGVSCRICDHANCPQRAQPRLKAGFAADPAFCGLSAFEPFSSGDSE